jgi:hypothetical protein
MKRMKAIMRALGVLSRRGTWLGAAAAAALTAGCEVTNPGPVDDAYISLPASQAGFVNGSWERLNRVIGNGAYNEALPAREIFPGGQTGSYGQSASRQAGNMGNSNAAGPYNEAQQARWIAEEAIRQFEARGDVPNTIMIKAYLAAGFANRVNGDYFCFAVIDGGPLLPGKHYWERAEGHFTKALAIAPDVDSKNAALAGRAQARLALANYAGAAADAALVPTTFVYWLDMDFSKGGNTNTRNHVFWANSSTPYRSWTVNFTNYHQYYADTGDPRTPWTEFALAAERTCNAALTGYGAVPCTRQMKYQTQDDDIRLASGNEMRLIEAEALLRQNNHVGAMAKINQLRTTIISQKTQRPLDPWPVTTLDDAWTILYRERGIEFWLEGRRFADLRRWSPFIEGLGLPGQPNCFAGAAGEECMPLAIRGKIDWPDFEAKALLFKTNLIGKPAQATQERPRNFCYNISSTERNLNPNFKTCEDEVEGCTVGGTP